MDILLGIEGTRTSAYHPQGNGQVERFNRTLEAILAKTVKSNQRNWDTCLHKALFAYRTAIRGSTGYTPFHLMFGRSPQLPIDVMLGRVDDQSGAFSAYTPYVQELHEKLRNAYRLVRESLAAAHAQQKKIYDKKISESAFKIGDRVWLFVPAVPTGRTKKLASLWRGPDTVVDKTGPVNYRVQLIGSTATLVVHRNRLKPCFGDPQQPGNNLSHQSAQANDTGRNTMSYRDALVNGTQGIGGYTSSSTITQDASPSPSSQQQTYHSRPVRNRRPPDRYGIYIEH